MKKLALVIALVLFVAGCSAPRGWRYSSDNYDMQKPIVDKVVAVPPFKDSRPDKNTNAIMMYLVPLMPYGWVDLATPEAGSTKLASTSIWQFDPQEDLAKAAAEELNDSGLFKEVFLARASPRVT